MEPGSKEVRNVETSVGRSRGKRNLPMQTDEINFKILIMVLSNSSLPSERIKLQLVLSQASYVEIRYLFLPLLQQLNGNSICVHYASCLLSVDS